LHDRLGALDHHGVVRQPAPGQRRADLTNRTRVLTDPDPVDDLIVSTNTVPPSWKAPSVAAPAGWSCASRTVPRALAPRRSLVRDRQIAPSARSALARLDPQVRYSRGSASVEEKSPKPGIVGSAHRQSAGRDDAHWRTAGWESGPSVVLASGDGERDAERRRTGKCGACSYLWARREAVFSG
jgi:hypothetical protein